MRRFAVVVGLFLFVAPLLAQPAPSRAEAQDAARPRLTADDYARAERFMGYNTHAARLSQRRAAQLAPRRSLLVSQ